MNRHMYARDQEKNELYHHGIKGQKWGIRRYQNKDGSLTSAGQRRYSKQLYKKLALEKGKNYGNLLSFQDVKNDLRGIANKQVKEKASKLAELEKRREDYYKKSKEFEESTEMQEAYKSAYESAKDYAKKNNLPDNDIDFIADHFFMDKGYYDEAYEKWKENNKSAYEYEKQWDKAYSETLTEVKKQVHGMINEKFYNKPVTEPGSSSAIEMGQSVTYMILENALKEARGK